MVATNIQWGRNYRPIYDYIFICCINRFTSLCKNLFNLLEFLAEAFRGSSSIENDAHGIEKLLLKTQVEQVLA